ncbi:hypothetical protein [Neobacillus sp. Marseille-QA0830]
MKKWIYFVLLLIFIISLCTYIKIEKFPFGFRSVENRPNTTIQRYKVNQTFETKQDIVRFLEKKLEYSVDPKRIIVEKVAWKTVYLYDYTNKEIYCSSQYIKVSEAGDVLEYSSCGK